MASSLHITGNPALRPLLLEMTSLQRHHCDEHDTERKGGCTGGGLRSLYPACSLLCALLGAGLSPGHTSPALCAALLLNAHLTARSADPALSFGDRCFPGSPLGPELAEPQPWYGTEQAKPGTLV
ncbi:unnamed protein product [Gadus morhua 'NCC']